MSKIIIVVSAVALLIISTANVVFAGSKMAVEGNFTVEIDFSTLTLAPVGGNCHLKAEVELVFTGTLEGVANGPIRVLVLAPCGDVSAFPPGTFKDVFRSNLEFMGTLDGEPVIADAKYGGVTDAGGAIKGLMHLSNGLKGVLNVNAVAAFGGSYQGKVMSD